MSMRVSIRQLAILLYFLLLLIALPVCVYLLYKHKAPSNVQAWFIGGIFVMAAVPISLWTILNHLVNYTKPYLQRHIIRVLWMVPIYAIDAWISLKFSKAAIYFNTLRECYEAYVIYNFMAFLLNYLRHEYPDIEFMVEQKQQIKHFAPCCLVLKPWPMGRSFIDRCRHGVLQYTVVRAVTVVIAFICEMCGVYGENEFHWNKAYAYLVFINNASQIWAMYCLILFYRCMRLELKPMHPVAKFICIKFVVFMSFWQSVLISILVAWGIIDKVQSWHMYSPNEVSSGLQNFAICIEMFIAAVAHHYSFPYRPYVDTNASYNDCCWSFWSMWDVSDVRNDVVDHVRHVGNSVRSVVLRPDKASTIGRRGENTPLMEMASSDGEYDSIDSSIRPRIVSAQSVEFPSRITPSFANNRDDSQLQTALEVAPASMSSLDTGHQYAHLIVSSSPPLSNIPEAALSTALRIGDNRNGGLHSLLNQEDPGIIDRPNDKMLEVKDSARV